MEMITMKTDNEVQSYSYMSKIKRLKLVPGATLEPSSEWAKESRL